MPRETRGAPPRLAEQLAAAVENQMPKIVEDWRASLAKGEVTAEMIDVFSTLGFLSSRQDPRLTDIVRPRSTTPSPGRRGVPEPSAGDRLDGAIADGEV